MNKIRKMCDISTSELINNREKFFENINDLKFKEFMVNTVTEKAIIREEINRIEDAIKYYYDVIEERKTKILNHKKL